MHSDEIYTSVAAGSKDLQTPAKEPMIVYVRKTQMSLNGQGKGLKEFNEKVTLKNPYIKAYYPHRHSSGSDDRDFIEALYYNSLADLEKSNDKQTEFINAAWTKEEDRKKFMTEMNKAFTGIHGDYIYHNEPSLSK